MNKLFCFTLLMGLFSCIKDQSRIGQGPYAMSVIELRYLALGDSYTIGTGITADSAYARRLGNALATETWVHSVETQLIAKNGWTTGNLIDELAGSPPDTSFDLVSLLIGVNNQYQRLGLAEYRLHFRQLLEYAIVLAAKDHNRVFVISIPDYGVSPAGRPNAEAIGKAIDQFNLINRQISDSLGVRYFNITEISRRALNSPDLIASDGLHFSAKMHQLWLDEMYPGICRMLKF